jgi:hypothetical protein
VRCVWLLLIRLYICRVAQRASQVRFHVVRSRRARFALLSRYEISASACPLYRASY